LPNKVTAHAVVPVQWIRQFHDPQSWELIFVVNEQDSGWAATVNTTEGELQGRVDVRFPYEGSVLAYICGSESNNLV